MLEDIDALKTEIKTFEIKSEEDLEDFRLTFLARNGKIKEMFTRMREVPNDQKAQVGKAMNATRELAQEKFDQHKHELEQPDAEITSATDDLTLEVPPAPIGTLHPLTLIQEEIKEIFYRLGFTISHGPELEDDFHNFTALNFPPDHPARDMQDTFFIRKHDDPEVQDLVLRTHTSPVQIRLMEYNEPPIRAIMPGRVYRNEAITAKSFCLFHQVEALYVDKHVSMAELKETLIMFARMLYGEDVKYRLRPSYFPFTEPSLEMDIWWDAKGSGQWLEILGAGMVDPNVLEAVDLDPEVYSGFAIGMGVERLAMLRHSMNDIRTFYENDVRFLNQFMG